MLHDVLGDCLDERVVAHRLHEDCSAVMAWGGRDVHLDGESQVFLQQPMVNVLDALEPGKAAIVDVVRLVVEDGELVDLAHDLAEVGLAVGRLTDGLFPERREEIVAQVVIFERRVWHVAEIDAVDVR